MNKEELIRKIAEEEYKMMDAVQGAGGRASCQDDRELFCAMRCCQFRSWNEETLESYAKDLDDAAESGRNLVTEKYARMMEQTDPVNYEKIKDFLPPVSEAVWKETDEICEIVVNWQKEAIAKYPALTSNGRSLENNEESKIGGTSFHNYLKSEILTYSEPTIHLYRKMVEEKQNCGINMNLENLLETVHYYGYSSLEEAEQKKRR